MPWSADDLAWLRRHGIDVLVSLSEDPPPRQWVNDAGLMGVHFPIPDFTAPTDDQLDQIMDTVNRAVANDMGVAVHCTAGKGRTGTVLAAYFVSQGLDPDAAIAKVRQLRSGSIETPDQEEAVRSYGRRIRGEV